MWIEFAGFPASLAGMVRRIVILALALAFLGAGGRAATSEPRNLALLKAEIVTYIDSGRYGEEIAVVAKEAVTWIEKRAGTGGKLAVVFDIDETMLSNLPHIRSFDFGYLPAAWEAWVARGEAPVIEPVREVYRVARKLGVEVIYITGRREKDRAGTEKNLRAAEVGDYGKLFLKPTDTNETTGHFKTAVRKKLTEEGYTIIANIGDQESDLEDGYAERTFKLPDPFYLVK